MERLAGHGAQGPGQALMALSEWELQGGVLPECEDIRGWPVLDRHGHTLGEVDEALVDGDTGLMRYLVVAFEPPGVALELESPQEAQVLLPVGLVRAAHPRGWVCLDTLDLETLEQCPRYRPTLLSRNFEHSVLQALASSSPFGVHWQEPLYEQPAFNPHGLRTARERRSGGSWKDDPHANPGFDPMYAPFGTG